MKRNYTYEKSTGIIRFEPANQTANGICICDMRALENRDEFAMAIIEALNTLKIEPQVS